MRALTKTESLIRDFIGDTMCNIEKCQTEEELNKLLALFDKKCNEVKVLLDYREAQMLNVRANNLRECAECKRNYLKNNNRIENIKAILFN